MGYSVRPLPSFERSLDTLDKQIARRILGKINRLAENPELVKGPMGNMPKDLAGLHKGRVGDWRVFFWVDHEKKELVLYDIDKRDHVYKNLFKRK